MLGSGSKFDTNNHNFFARKVETPAPINAPEKVKGVEKPEGDSKPKEENPFAKRSIFAVAREEGHSAVSEEQPPQNYDGHKFGNKFFSPYS